MIHQNTPEWLQFRKDKVGASDAPIIMKVSPWRTPYQLWEEKLELATQRPKSLPMLEGSGTEVQAREELEKLTGHLFFPEVILHPQEQWMMASVDAIDPERKCIAEIKCPGKEDHSTAQSGQVPEHYFPQLQHQLEVCQLEMMYYFSFHISGNVLLKVHRDEKYIKEMMKKEKEFWECVQTIVAPELTEKDFEPVEDSYRLSLFAELAALRRQIKPMEEREKELQEKIKEVCSQNAIGAGLKVSRFVRKGNIDYKNIPQLEGINLELYRKNPTEYWTFKNT